MNAVPENGPKNRPMFCELCNYVEFSSYAEFNRHHLTHIRQPRVSLSRLSNSCVEKLRRGSYRVNTGVARRSNNRAPSMSLSVVNQNGSDQFLVVKKQNQPSSSNREEYPQFDCLTFTPEMEKEEEMLKRLGSRVSVTRRRRTSTRNLNRSNTTNAAESTSTNTTPTTPVPKLGIRVPYVKLERLDAGESHTSGNTPTKRAKTEASHDSSSHSSNSNTPVSHAVAEPTKIKIANVNDSPVTESRKCSLTKYSNCGKKKQQSPQEINENDSAATLQERAETPRRVPEHRSSAECQISDQVAISEDTNMNTTEPPPIPSTSSGFPMNTDLSACVQQQTGTSNNANSGVELAASTLINTNLKNQDTNTENYNIPAHASESYVEATNFVTEAEEVQGSLCESLTSDGQDSRRGPQQPNEQAAFLSSLQRAMTINPNPNQDLLLGHSLPNNDTIAANFLHSILSGQLQYGIATENAEFLSLERLAAQHQQTANNTEVTHLDQLTQQVHQLSSTPQQFTNVSHIMQAPPPLHAAGVPLSQQQNCERVAHIQPTMGPPPLFQGFTMFPNQAFQQQGSSQVIPRPPALQQCPQLQVGGYQNLAQPQPNRQKPRPNSTRNIPKPPTPQEMVAAKQHKSEPAIKGKSQPSKGKGKGKAPAKPPTSGPRTQPKKTMDPQVVASILAARGITVTPSTSRHSNTAQKPRQKSMPSGSAIKIGSDISIRPPKQNPTNNGKKTENAGARAPRRNSAPVVNNDIERPKRCRTVDLTEEKEPQEDLNAPGPSVNRFLCNQCGQKFPTAASLELHRASHQSTETPTFRCEPCNIEFSVAEDLERHRGDNHKYRRNGPNWVIPVIDLDFPGAEERLLEYGITNFIPLSFDEDEGNLTIPIVRQDTPRQHREFVGMSNAIVLGPIRSLLGPRHY